MLIHIQFHFTYSHSNTTFVLQSVCISLYVCPQALQGIYFLCSWQADQSEQNKMAEHCHHLTVDHYYMPTMNKQILTTNDGNTYLVVYYR